jgi:hypothetical protein
LSIPSNLLTGKPLLGNISRKNCPGLSQTSLEGPAVDRKEQCAPGDILSFPEMNLFEQPIDLRLDKDR